MNNRRPTTIIRFLAITAVVGFVGSALLDVHGRWGEPRQAFANVCWIMFLLSVVGLLVVGGRILLRRRERTA